MQLKILFEKDNFNGCKCLVLSSIRFMTEIVARKSRHFIGRNLIGLNKVRIMETKYIDCFFTKSH